MLIRGTIRAVLGAGIICWVGLSDVLVAQYGLLAFALGLGMIAWGLIPYNRLKKYLLAPAKITVTEKALIYERLPHYHRELAVSDIASAAFCERKPAYGLEVVLKNQEKIFFPYFTKTDATEITELLTVS